MLVLMHELDIIGITETFLDDSVYDSHILTLGYVAYRRDHERHGGGVMILARKGITIVHGTVMTWNQTVR